MISIVARAAVARGVSSMRFLSSNCEPAQKLKCIFEDYRREHFSRETPTRFRKEIIKAAESAGHVKGSVEVDRINQLLTNIGRPERFSKDELDAILAEAGAAREQRAIPIDKMIQLM